MKDLIQEGRKIQETFKKNVNESEQIPMFAPDKKIDILGQTCPVCEKGKIVEDFHTLRETLECNYKGPDAECGVEYPERRPLEKYWKEFTQKMKSIPKQKPHLSVINWNRNQVYVREFWIKLQKEF